MRLVVEGDPFQEEEFTVLVVLENEPNPGLTRLEITLAFAPEILIINTQKGELFSKLTKDSTGTVFTVTSSASVAKSGTILVIRCKLDADFGPEDVFALDFSSHAWSGTVESDTEDNPGFISPIIWGDANGDGEVDTKDITILKQYLANFDDTTGTSSVEVFPGADANGDGKIDTKDITILKQYLANYDDETGESSVVLGQ